MDVPWMLPLLLSVCELVYVGGAGLRGDANYSLVAQAALSSCAIVASCAVATHVQLAQELNNAALNAAEDTANAVRTAGVRLRPVLLALGRNVAASDASLLRREA